MCRFGLEESDVQAICAVFSRNTQIEKAVLYGSRAKGNYKHGSDIDLTLLGGEALTLDALYHVMADIDDLLLPYMFDLSIFHRIDDPELVAHIQRVGITFYEMGKANPVL